jgi:hypothetical protein
MNDEMILEKLLTPEQNDAEIERRNGEKRRQFKEIQGFQRVGIAWYRSVSVSIGWYRLVSLWKNKKLCCS